MEAIERRRREPAVLVPLGDVDARPHRELQTGGVRLGIEVRVVLPGDVHHQPARLGLLDLGDAGAELRDAQRDELLADDLRVQERRHRPCPCGAELAEVVVGGQRVDARSEVLDHVLHDGNDLLLRHRSGTERVLVRDATFILVVVEVEHLVLIHDWPDGFALGARESGHDHVDLVVEDQPARQRLELRVVGLRVGSEQLDLATEHALVPGLDQVLRWLGPYRVVTSRRSAVVHRGLDVRRRRLRGHLGVNARTARTLDTTVEGPAVVDLLDGELRPVPFVEPEDGEVPRAILEQAELDGSGAPGRLGAQQRGSCEHSGPGHSSGLDQVAPGEPCRASSGSRSVGRIGWDANVDFLLVGFAQVALVDLLRGSSLRVSSVRLVGHRVLALVGEPEL